MARTKPKVFLDASVLIAAVLSSSGGSFYVLSQFKGDFEFQTSSFGFEEVIRVLDRKFPGREDLKDILFLLLGATPVRILADPPYEAVTSLAAYINVEDRPILASALANSSFLLTLDHDFMTDTVIAFSQRNGLQILKPKGFIEKHWA
jgi:predicted nucleic acid-binding protein